MDKKKLIAKFINGELHAEDLIDMIVERDEKIEKFEKVLSEVVNQQSGLREDIVTIIQKKVIERKIEEKKMNIYDNQVVAKRIKELRKKNNLSQEQLAQMLGMQRTTITNYESERIVPPSNVLFAFAEIFSVSTDYILGRDSKSLINSLNEEEEKLFKNALLDIKQIIEKVNV